jgi:chloramphenicol-sensitive protein RarD
MSGTLWNRLQSSGVGEAMLAYLIWGIFPLYWFFLKHIPPLELLAYRVFWSFILLALVLMRRKTFGATLRQMKKKRHLLGIPLMASLMIGLNWFLYIWAISHHHVIEASLGYFINPFINFLLGVLFFKERFSFSQMPSLIFIFSGLFYLTWHLGVPPLLSLSLTMTFAAYAVCKKISPWESFDSLWIETLFLLIPASLYLIYLYVQGKAFFLFQQHWWQELLVIGAGPMTIVPLYLFGSGAKKISLSLLGILQYISPTGQFLLGYFLFHEPFNQIFQTTFSFIWIGLFLFTLQNIVTEIKKGKRVLPLG